MVSVWHPLWQVLGGDEELEMCLVHRHGLLRTVRYEREGLGTVPRGGRTYP